MSRKQLAVEIIWSERLLCGGEWKSRKQLYKELLSEGFEQRYVDWYLFCLSQHQPKEGAMGEGQQPAPMPGLIEGRMVHYVGSTGRHEASVVIEVFDAVMGRVKLRNLYNLTLDTCEYSETPVPDSWHWIEKA